jgi:wyosine [tRNA(Phe)-imidazoG37] synthetase (radical SAM superfamily)
MPQKPENIIFKHVFGPVRSRRLGISLGVDLIPAKTCNQNCVYCEAGKTSDLTNERKEFFPLSEILDELFAFLSSGPKLDFITFSGAGEPTLYSKIGEVISGIKGNFPEYKICLLTNGILIGHGSMPDELRLLDLIIPSLDASDEDTFQKINRPAKGLNFEYLKNSLAMFRKRNPVEMRLELFIVPGANDSDLSLKNFAEIISVIKPDKIQLNGLDRPAFESWVRKADAETALKFKGELEKICPVEIILKPAAEFCSSENSGAGIKEKILGLVSRRPCTAEEISLIFGIDATRADAMISELLRAEKVSLEKMDRGVFVVPNRK